MPARLHSRLKRLEAQRQARDGLHGHGLSAVLAYARAHHIEAVPLDTLTDAELDAQITTVTGGDDGLSSLLREHLEDKRAQRLGVPAVQVNIGGQQVNVAG